MTAPLSADAVRRLHADGGVRLVDVRSPGEFAAVRVPGSVGMAGVLALRPHDRRGAPDPDEAIAHVAR